MAAPWLFVGRAGHSCGPKRHVSQLERHQPLHGVGGIRLSCVLLLDGGETTVVTTRSSMVGRQASGVLGFSTVVLVFFYGGASTHGCRTIQGQLQHFSQNESVGCAEP